MLHFSDLLKAIRQEAGLSRAQLAEALEVSTILITLVETRHKEVSKNLIVKISERLEVHPAAITPFLYLGLGDAKKSSSIEKRMIAWAESMQIELIKKKGVRLRKYVANYVPPDDDPQ